MDILVRCAFEKNVRGHERRTARILERIKQKSLPKSTRKRQDYSSRKGAKKKQSKIIINDSLQKIPKFSGKYFTTAPFLVYN